MQQGCWQEFIFLKVESQQHMPKSLDVDGLVQDCSNPIANALELLQSCNEPSINDADIYAHKILMYIILMS